MTKHVVKKKRQQQNYATTLHKKPTVALSFLSIACTNFLFLTCHLNKNDKQGTEKKLPVIKL